MQASDEYYFIQHSFNNSSNSQSAFERVNRGQIRFNFHALRKGTETVERCQSKNPIIIKTIRLHKETLHQWINTVDFKVVHLVRDPR